MRHLKNNKEQVLIYVNKQMHINTHVNIFNEATATSALLHNASKPSTKTNNRRLSPANNNYRSNSSKKKKNNNSRSNNNYNNNSNMNKHTKCYDRLLQESHTESK